jgi:F-type H+-transporting ATPase subunit epsilon
MMMDSQDHISMMILTPEKTLVEKSVSKVSLPGTKGRFMILKDHAPLISSLEDGEIRFESEGMEESLMIASGFVEVLDNVVIVCAEV